MARPVVLSVLMLALLTGLAHADPAVSDSFRLALTAMPYAYNPVAVKYSATGADTCYAYRPGASRIWRSVDDGVNWTSVYARWPDDTGFTAYPFDLFVTSKGWVLYPTGSISGETWLFLFKGDGAGALKVAGKFKWNCCSTSPQAQLWNATEDTVGIDKVYVGEYGGGLLDTCAYIWQGTWADTGYVWAVENDPKHGGVVGRHVHGLWSRPGTDDVYGFLGDRGAGYTNADGYMVRSTDDGETWAARPNPAGAELQMLTLGFGASGKRVIGTDRGGANETNFFMTTTDDSTYAKVDSLTSDTVPWCSSKGPDGTIYVGTVTQTTGTTATPAIYMTRDEGATWKCVRALTPYATAYKGVYRMSPFTSTGYSFFFIDKPTGEADVTYRFSLEPFVQKTNWLIGTGADADFATAQSALQYAAVGAGDTLTLKSGQTHRITSSVVGSLNTNMTVCGQSGDAADVIVRQLTDGSSAFTADSTGIVLRDFTVRAYVDTAGTPTAMTSPVISMGGDGATLTMRDVDFRGILADHTGVGVCIDASPASEIECGNSVRLVGCEFDSISNANASTSKRGALSFRDIQRVVVDSCSFTRNSSRHGPLYCLYDDAEPATPFDLKVMHTLFAGNTSATTAGGGAMRISFTTGDEEAPIEAADTDTLLIDYVTMWDNDIATAANGQLYLTSETTCTVFADLDFMHSIIVGDGVDYAMRNPPGSIVMGDVSYTDCYNNILNHLWGTALTDTLQVNPVLVTTAYDSTRAFMPQACAVRVTGDASYMGYIAPKVTTAVPTVATPAWGAASTATTIAVTWNAAAYADSYQVRFGSTCGTGSTGTPTAELADTLTVTANARYYWQVRARDCDGWGEYSGCSMFGSGGGGSSVGHGPWNRIGHKRRAN